MNSRPGFRFGMRTLMVAVVGISVLLGAIHHFFWRPALAKKQLESTCQKLGGHMTTGLVDLDLFIHLDGCHLSREALRQLPQLWSQCVGEFWGPADVNLTLHDAEFDGDPLTLFTDNLVSITGPGLPIDDAGLKKIPELSPRLWKLDLRGSRVSEQALLTFLDSQSLLMVVEIDSEMIDKSELARIKARSVMEINEH